MSADPVVLTVSASGSTPLVERRLEPVSTGVHFPRSAVQASARWRLTDPAGIATPVQTSALDCWSDGSLRWLLVEFPAHVRAGDSANYRLESGESAEPPEPPMGLDERKDGVRVSTGVATVDISLSDGTLIRVNGRAGERLLAATVITAEDDHGKQHGFTARNIHVERRGHVSTVVRIDGHFGSDVSPWLDGSLRLRFFAGLATVSGELSVTNPRAANHPGGTWDLGDSGSVLVRDLSVEFTTDFDQASPIVASLEAADGMQPAGESFSVYQDSSGGENWQHVNHANRDGHVCSAFRGFRCSRNGQAIDGLRATPIASIGSDASRLSVAVPRFWQMFPKSMAAEHSRLVIGMFPRQYGDLHELQGGERSTLRFALCIGEDTVSEEPLAWMREPLLVRANPPQQIATTSATTGGSAQASEQFLALVNAAILGPCPFEMRREIIDEYGWRNFGDLFADHEAVNTSLVSHYNNQYDALAGFITRYIETGDDRWRALIDDLALHVADVDLYHTDRDRAAYNRGHFWHTQHYQPAGTATHRAYSRRSGSSGGGPSAEHNYTTGLMLHYFSTGSERSRQAVIQLAEWVLAMDDGTRSRFRWIDKRDTGHASATRSPDFHGPGRGAGNSINALLDAHRLTGDSRYIKKAEALVTRCVHPRDDIDALDLLDVENRWSYTVFLQVLGKYLEHRVERGLIDYQYEYARMVLTKYAAWMSEHERPYLDTPDKLEFPTETWSAQDLRKAAVFEFAAKYTTDAGQKSVFLDRARSFVDKSVAYLASSPTAHLTRPIVLLLAYMAQRPQVDPAVPIGVINEHEWPPKVPFMPQRDRVLRRIVWAGAGLSAAAVLIVILLVS